MNKLQVIDLNGQQTIDSRLVAEALEMQHKDLLKKVRNYEGILTSAKLRPLDFFIPNEYKDGKGETRKCYLLTKKGCEMVANKTTGEKGVVFTALYVSAFNEMESQPKLPTDPRELLSLTIKAHEDTAKRVDSLETEVKDLKDNAFLSPSEYNLVSTRINERVKYIITAFHLKTNQKQRSELYKAINREIKVITGIKARCQLRQKDLDKVLDFINTWEPSKATMIVVEQLAFNFDEGGNN